MTQNTPIQIHNFFFQRDREKERIGVRKTLQRDSIVRDYEKERERRATAPHSQQRDGETMTREIEMIMLIFFCGEDGDFTREFEDR